MPPGLRPYGAGTGAQRLFTVRGGHRIGICKRRGADGEVRNLRQLSSLAIRVAREVPGLSAAVLDRLGRGRSRAHCPLPPGGGKTTLLRI
ncbi:MAG: hypothetical protein ACLRIS_01485 [Flavonifractor plautii]